MSVEQVKAFFDKVKSDETLAQKLKDTQDAYTGDKSDKDAAIAAVVIPVAAQAGFNFTVADFNAAFEFEGEVSEDELDAVAGGGSDEDKVKKAYKECGNLSARQELCGSVSFGLSCTWGIQT